MDAKIKLKIARRRVLGSIESSDYFGGFGMIKKTEKMSPGT